MNPGALLLKLKCRKYLLLYSPQEATVQALHYSIILTAIIHAERQHKVWRKINRMYNFFGLKHLFCGGSRRMEDFIKLAEHIRWCYMPARFKPSPRLKDYAHFSSMTIEKEENVLEGEINLLRFSLSDYTLCSGSGFFKKRSKIGCMFISSDFFSFPSFNINVGEYLDRKISADEMLADFVKKYKNMQTLSLGNQIAILNIGRHFEAADILTLIVYGREVVNLFAGKDSNRRVVLKYCN